jgi:hypothetical protein
VLESNGFQVVKTTANPRHFTIALPNVSDETISLLASLMQRWIR